MSRLVRRLLGQLVGAPVVKPPAAFGPEAVEIQPRSLRLGAEWCRTFTVTGYPREVGLGWLEPLSTHPGRLDVALHIQPVPAAIAAEKGVRARVLEICAEAARSLGFEPEVRFVGAIDRQVSASVATELLSTLREALANVARHARARHTEVELSVDGEVHLRVTDDGVGHEGSGHRSGRGLPNMAERAESLGGSFRLSTRPGGGTEVSWRVPLGR